MAGDDASPDVPVSGDEVAPARPRRARPPRTEAIPIPIDPLASQPAPPRPRSTTAAKSASPKTAAPGKPTSSTRATPKPARPRAAKTTSEQPAVADRRSGSASVPDPAPWLTPLGPAPAPAAPEEPMSWADMIGGAEAERSGWFEPPEPTAPVEPAAAEPVAPGSWFEPPGADDPPPTQAERVFFGAVGGLQVTDGAALAAPVAAPEPLSVSEPSSVVSPLPMTAPHPSRKARRLARKPRARRVVRIVRRVDPWSVLKISFVFYVVLYLVLLVAGVLLWAAAVSTGTIDNIEGFITKLFALDEFTFDGGQIFRASWIGGLVLVAAGTFFNVMLSVLFNLISDLVGGLRFTVLEVEVVRRAAPVPVRPVAAPGDLTAATDSVARASEAG